VYSNTDSNPTADLKMSACGDGDVCWSRADPLTLLKRMFTSKEAAATHRVALAVRALLGPAAEPAAMAALAELRKAGFDVFRVQQDGARAEYEAHIVEATIARRVLAGAMTLTSTFSAATTATETTLEAGDTCVVQAGSTCAMRTGDAGCTYMVATREL
jgi:hypothetical protein